MRLAERGSPPATPRWVKALGVVALVLLLLVLVLHLTGLAPTHKMPRSSPSGETPTFGVVERDA